MIDELVFEDIARRLPAGIYVSESTTGIHWCLYGLVRLMQPERVVEIGTCQGDATCYLVRAVMHNGHGTVAGYECVPGYREVTQSKVLAACGKYAPISMHDAFPLEGADKVAADFVFLDLDPKVDYFRAFDHLELSPGAILCAHDLTYSDDAKTVAEFREMLAGQGFHTLGMPEERGLIIARRT